jgi:hypothetical protein
MEDHNQDNVADFGTVYIFPNRVARGDPGTINGCGSEASWPGVTTLTDAFTGFADQCNNHDLCYNKCGETQASCDDEFREMMFSSCNDTRDNRVANLSCKATAYTMYALVHKYGAEAYDAAQKQFACPK